MERLDRFMARANAAYYATRDPFRDFTTSPEISQVFGEILGLWAAVTWELIGRPNPVLLVECGPGRGTLMADALRAVVQVAPAFGAAVRLHLVETSPRLRALQAERLPGAVWHDRLEAVPAGPMLLVANEFLDALPIRQFVQREAGWMERYVEDGRFVEVAAGPLPHPPTPKGRGSALAVAPAPHLALPVAALPRGVLPVAAGAPAPHLAQPVAAPPRLALPAAPAPGLALPGDTRPRPDLPVAAPHSDAGAPGGVIHEMNEFALAIADTLGARFATQPGAALFLDYGPEHSAPGDSLQALRDGRAADPLSAPGTADLTAHVDFAAFAAAAHDAGAAAHGPIPQGVFLTRLGLFQRTGRLARGLPPARGLSLTDAARRLAEPDRMGRLFKALALCSPDCAIPPGFAG
jgi:SAM-dependent MidA family methyltransferase